MIQWASGGSTCHCAKDLRILDIIAIGHHRALALLDSIGNRVLSGLLLAPWYDYLVRISGRSRTDWVPKSPRKE